MDVIEEHTVDHGGELRVGVGLNIYSRIVIQPDVGELEVAFRLQDYDETDSQEYAPPWSSDNGAEVLKLLALVILKRFALRLQRQVAK